VKSSCCANSREWPTKRLQISRACLSAP
jgi:hypothetical protein